MKNVLKKNRANNIETRVTFIDLEQAYSNARRKQFWEEMKKINIREMGQYNGKTVLRVKSQIKIGNRRSKCFMIYKYIHT